MLHAALFKDRNCVVTDAVRISSLILITCVLLLSGRDSVELKLLMTLHNSVGFSHGFKNNCSQYPT